MINHGKQRQGELYGTKTNETMGFAGGNQDSYHEASKQGRWREINGRTLIIFQHLGSLSDSAGLPNNAISQISLEEETSTLLHFQHGPKFFELVSVGFLSVFHDQLQVFQFRDQLNRYERIEVLVYQLL